MASTPSLESYLQQALRDDKTGPMYRRLYGALLAASQDGIIQTSTPLPAERTLAELLGISRVTVRKALNLLADSGDLIRQQGSRTRFAPRLEKSVSRLTGFSEDMRCRGHTPSSRWLSRSIGPAEDDEAELLGIVRSSPVSRLTRVRYSDRTPVALEIATIPCCILPDPSLVKHSLYAILAALGARPMRGRQRLRARSASNDEAQILHCKPGDPLLHIERVCYASNDRCVELARTSYLGSAYDFITDLS